MSLFGKSKTAGITEEIRCDETSYLIWRWRPSDNKRKKNSQDDRISWDSFLKVKDGEVAVLTHNREREDSREFILGPFEETLGNIAGIGQNDNSLFQADVYFINLAKVVQVKFGVPYFDIYDPRYEDFGVPVAVRGTISFKISDYRQFIKLHRLTDFNLEDFKKQVRDAVIRYVKDTVTNAPACYDIPLVQIETKISQINDVIEFDVGERLRESFGVEVSGVDISGIDLDKCSEGYIQLMSITRDITAASMKAEAAAKAKEIADRQRIESENYAEGLRIDREEEQYARRKLTQTSNLEAFRIEKRAEAREYFSKYTGQNPACRVDNKLEESEMVNQGEITPPPILPEAYYVAVTDSLQVHLI